MAWHGTARQGGFPSRNPRSNPPPAIPVPCGRHHAAHPRIIQPMSTHPGQDARTGRFVTGNRLGKGRPYRSVTLIRTYGEAIERSCPPETLAAVVAKAVKHALGDGPQCDGARMFLLRVARCRSRSACTWTAGRTHRSITSTPSTTASLNCWAGSAPRCWNLPWRPKSDARRPYPRSRYRYRPTAIKSVGIERRDRKKAFAGQVEEQTP